MHFQGKYPTDRYYDNKRKDLHELKLGKKTMEEHIQKFMKLLCYVDYIENERVKVQSFLGRLSSSYKERIEITNP